MNRYGFRLRLQRVNRRAYGVIEIVRLSDGAKLYEVWARPIGRGQAEADYLRQLLEAAPDDQAEAIIEEHKVDCTAKAVARASDALRQAQKNLPPPDAEPEGGA